MNQSIIKKLEKKLSSHFSDTEFFTQCNKANLKPAAVIIALFEKENELHVLLTKRTRHLANHASQVCFPGGGFEVDDKTLLTTAFREAHEEIGLAEENFTIIGSLPPRQTVSGFLVLPLVMQLKRPFELTINPNEIEQIITVPLDHFINPGSYSTGEIINANVRRTFYKIRINNHIVWGVTADILHELCETLFKKIS